VSHYYGDIVDGFDEVMSLNASGVSFQQMGVALELKQKKSHYSALK
jgi:hypothetical protein